MKRALHILLLLALCAMPAVAQDTDAARGSVVVIGSVRYYVHTVSDGDTFDSLSRLYDTTESAIKNNNPQLAEGLHAGQVIKIPVTGGRSATQYSERRRDRLFDTHVINSGETLYSVSRRYEIPVDVLIADNDGLDPTHLRIGQEIYIRKSSQGEGNSAQITRRLTDYTDAMNSVSDSVKYHFVQQGETLYAISRTYDVSEQAIIDANGLTDGLKAGSMIKIPVTTAAVPQIAVDSIARDSTYDWRLWPPTSMFGRDEDNVQLRSLYDKSVINVSLLLPLSRNGKVVKNFVEFYQGVLLGLEDIKRNGISVHLSLYNTDATMQRVREIVQSADFASTDLIIGPVYDENMEPVVQFAHENGVAVVSPLSVVEHISSPLIYQMTPAPADKYRKLLEFIAGDKNIVYIATAHPDKDMESDLRPLLPQSTHVINYTKGTQDEFERALNRRGENIYIVSCVNEFTVDEILAKISSIQNNIVARSAEPLDIHIVGNSLWPRFRSNIDRDLFFKLNLCYVASYHADRSNRLIYDFDGRYMAAFSVSPTLYAYRGYDAVRLFVGASKTAGGTLIDRLNDFDKPLLQMRYHFVPATDGNNVNTNWALVFYNNNYSIEVQQ